MVTKQSTLTRLSDILGLMRKAKLGNRKFYRDLKALSLELEKSQQTRASHNIDKVVNLLKATHVDGCKCGPNDVYSYNIWKREGMQVQRGMKSLGKIPVYVSDEDKGGGRFRGLSVFCRCQVKPLEAKPDGD